VGSYPVSLVVTDNSGGHSTAWSGTAQIDSTATDVQFVGQAQANANTANPTVTVPAAVVGGETELLFVSTAVTGVTGDVPGWTQLAQQSSAPLQTTVYQRTAPAGDAGNSVTVPLSAATQVDVQLLVYRGVAPDPVVLSAADANTASHTAPAGTIAVDRSWVLSYWAGRTSTAATWTLPDTITVRGLSYGKLGGHVDTAAADSGAPQAVGSYAAQTASESSPDGKGPAISVVLAPRT
jgi:hypothetical protein